MKSITVTGAHKSGDGMEFITASIYDKNNNLLKSKSSNYSVVIDLSDLSIIEKENCYIIVTYSRSKYAEQYGPLNRDWDNYPAGEPITAIATINNVIITY